MSYMNQKKKAVKKSRDTFRRSVGSVVIDDSETSALNVSSAPEEQVHLNTTEGASISRRDVALHIEQMEQRFAMDLKELKNQLNVEQIDHSNNSDTSLSNNSPNASQCT